MLNINLVLMNCTCGYNIFLITIGYFTATCILFYSIDAYATFDRAIYTVVEGANNVPSLIINTTFPTGDVQLQISQGDYNIH